MKYLLLLALFIFPIAARADVVLPPKVNLTWIGFPIEQALLLILTVTLCLGIGAFIFLRRRGHKKK